MSDKMYLCDEYKLYFKIEDDVEVLHNDVELYKAQFDCTTLFAMRSI